LALEWTISHPMQLVLAAAKGDVSPQDIENYFHGVSLAGGISYAKMFLVESGSMMSDENIKALGGVIRRYSLTDRIGPVAIVASTDEAFRQARVFASAATAERPIAVFRGQEEAARWLIRMVEGAERSIDSSSSTARDRWKDS
jgi:hypothetical protein